MVHTLKIVGITAGCLTLVLTIAIVSVIQNQPDPEIQDILTAPSAIEIFQKSHADLWGLRKGRISTLVDEAQAYTAKEKVIIVKVDEDENFPPSPPPPPSAKFDIIALCQFLNNPSMSCALIKMKAGNQTHLLNIGDPIGHQVIKDIQDGQLILQQQRGKALQTISMPCLSVHNLLQ